MNRSITRRTAIIATGASLAFAGRAQSAYPDKPIRLIVPFAPGGGTDVTARMLAERLRAELGQPVVMDNRPGATGTIGTASAMRSPADGYTLLFSTVTNQICAPLMMEKVPYDGVRDFTPIGLLVSYTGVLLASNSVPGKTFADFVAYAKQRPGKLNFGSSGIGSNNHLVGELVKATAGIDLVHVPYKGSAAAVQALAGDEVQLMLDSVPSARNWMQQGKVKALAVTSELRSKQLPDVPSLVELGVVDTPANYWMGLFAPPGLPAPVLTRLRDATMNVLGSPEWAEFAAKGAGEAGPHTPEQFNRLLASEQRRWADVIRRNNIRAT